MDIHRSHQRHRTDTGRLYEGALIHAAPGVHDHALELLKHFLPTGATIADLGAGSGAFSLRLRDEGFVVMAVDQEIAPISGVETIVDNIMELGALHRSSRKVDAVVCLEVIEHLSDPLLFLQRVYEAMNDGGLLLLSTPNVLHPYSRLKFLLKGTMWLFDREAYWVTGHSTPLPRWLLEQHLSKVGFADIRYGYAGSFDFKGAKRVIATGLRGTYVGRKAPLGSLGDRNTLFLTARRLSG